VGFFALSADWGVYFALLSQFHHPAWLFKSTSFLIGTIISFIMNGRLTFNATLSGSKFGRHMAVYFSSLIANTAVNQVLLEFLPWTWHLRTVVALGSATIVSIMMNYFGLKLLVFR
jgi:putative flippase GtrA